VPLRALEPYYHRAPWSEALGGRTVLVVHPFSNSIARQYSRRSVLFRDERILPAFELRVLQAVQSLVTAPPRFDTWFDAYEHMCAEISGIDFDVALLGCGAYGLPLAAHVKRLGKKSVHLGGALQILFGIKDGGMNTKRSPACTTSIGYDHWRANGRRITRLWRVAAIGNVDAHDALAAPRSSPRERRYRRGAI
jgi:hypothetical protein